MTASLFQVFKIHVHEISWIKLFKQLFYKIPNHRVPRKALKVSKIHQTFANLLETFFMIF